MPKPISIDDLNAAKEKIGFHWKWKPFGLPQKKNVGKSARAYFFLTCGLCLKDYWVEWGALKLGRSKCCTRCTTKKRVPTLDEMKTLVQKYNMLWQPSQVHKIDPKTYRRKYWMKCQCGKFEWVRWNHFQQGLTKGCKSCSARKVRNGLGKYDYSKSSLKKFWYYINRIVKENQVTKMWDTYEQFKSWSISTGFRQGARLLRRNPKGNFDNENCYWNTEKTIQTLAPHTARPKSY